MKRTVRNKKISNVIAYHDNCTDGFAAAVAAWEKFGDSEAIYIAVDHGKKPPKIFEGKNVYILDFSYPTSDLISIAKSSPQVVMIEHMISNREWFMENVGNIWIRKKVLPTNLHIIFDSSQTGALLSWKYFHEADPPYFFEVLKDYEKRKFLIPETKGVIEALRSRPYNFREWNGYLQKEGYLSLVAEGMGISRFLRFQSELLIAHNAHKVLLNVKGFSQEIILLNAPLHMVGEIADILTPQIGIVVMYQITNLQKDVSRVRVCLRSHDNGPDVSEIARKHGGGGHKHAAGFECSWALFVTLFT